MKIFIVNNVCNPLEFLTMFKKYFTVLGIERNELNWTQATCKDVIGKATLYLRECGQSLHNSKRLTPSGLRIWLLLDGGFHGIMVLICRQRPLSMATFSSWFRISLEPPSRRRCGRAFTPRPTAGRGSLFRGLLLFHFNFLELNNIVILREHISNIFCSITYRQHSLP